MRIKNMLCWLFQMLPQPQVNGSNIKTPWRWHNWFPFEYHSGSSKNDRYSHYFPCWPNSARWPSELEDDIIMFERSGVAGLDRHYICFSFLLVVSWLFGCWLFDCWLLIVWIVLTSMLLRYLKMLKSPKTKKSPTHNWHSKLY